MNARLHIPSLIVQYVLLTIVIKKGFDCHKIDVALPESEKIRPLLIKFPLHSRETVCPLYQPRKNEQTGK